MRFALARFFLDKATMFVKLFRSLKRCEYLNVGIKKHLCFRFLVGVPLTHEMNNIDNSMERILDDFNISTPGKTL